MGKTSLLHQFVHKRFNSSYRSTVGADFSSANVQVANKRVVLQVWDTAGQERFQSLGPSFFRGADACVLVFDVTEPKTFDNLETWKHEFEQQMGTNRHVPIIVVGNKIDLPNVRVQEAEIRRWCSQLNHGATEVPYFLTSAKDATQVEDAFKRVATLHVQNNPDDNDLRQPAMLQLKQQDQEKSGCC